MPVSAHDIPRLCDRDGVPDEHVEQLKAMDWPTLVAYCERVRLLDTSTAASPGPGGAVGSPACRSPIATADSSAANPSVRRHPHRQET